MNFNYSLLIILIHYLCCLLIVLYFFFQAEDGIRDLVRSRGLGDVYKRQGVAGQPVGRRGESAPVTAPGPPCLA